MNTLDAPYAEETAGSCSSTNTRGLWDVNTVSGGYGRKTMKTNSEENGGRNV